MTHLDRCMQETLRLYPPLVFLMRKVMRKPLEVGPYKVPVGDVIVASPQVSHRLPEGPDQVFTKPGSFDPDRFAAPRAEHKRSAPGSLKPEATAARPTKSQKTFIGFGAGYHSCRGEKFARVQVKTILAVMLRRYKVELVDPVPEPDFAAIVVGPKGGTRVKVTRREA